MIWKDQSGCYFKNLAERNEASSEGQDKESQEHLLASPEFRRPRAGFGLAKDGADSNDPEEVESESL